MARRPVATGADAERGRLLAAERDGVPWRRWTPILDAGGPGALPGISGVEDDASGLRVIVRLASRARHQGAATVCSMIATPTASYLESIVRTTPNGAGQPDLEIRLRCAKRAAEDLVIRIRVTNRGSRSAIADLATHLETLDDRLQHDDARGPTIRAVQEVPGADRLHGVRVLTARHPDLGDWWLVADPEPAGTDAFEDEGGACLRSRLVLDPGETRTLRLRLNHGECPKPPVGADAEATLGTRAREATAFLASLRLAGAGEPVGQGPGEAFAWLVWGPWPAEATLVDQVFAALGLAVADPVAAQGRLSAIIDRRLRGPGASTEPPVAAWAALRIHELVVASTGRRDHDSLERLFHVLLDDYSRWVDRLDPSERNALQGGLLGLDGTGSTAASAAWMACYSIWMLALAVELARDDPTYQDVAVTFLDTTLAMVSALDDMGGSGSGMWDENDGWYHDVVRAGDGEVARIAGRSAIGLVPLLAVAVISRESLDRLPEVAVRLGWSLRHDVDLEGSVVRAPGDRGARGDTLVSLVPAYRRVRVLNRLDRGGIDIPPPMACLLLDVLDRLRVFGAGDARDVAHLRSALMTCLESGAPVWAPLLASAMRRALRD